MMQIRDMRRNHWFRIDNCIIRHYGKDLGSTGIAVYALLCCHADNSTQESFPSVGKMGELLKLGPATVRRALQKMQRLELLIVEPRLREDGSQTSNLYVLLDPPILDDRVPLSRMEGALLQER